MDGIPEIGLLAFGLLYVFRVGQNRPEAALFQDVEHRYPVFPGGFHADILHAMALEPCAHGADITVCGLELPDIKDRIKSFGICLADCGHKDLLMHIDARADRAFDVTISRCDDTGAIIHSEGSYLIKRICPFGPDMFSLCVSFFVCHMLSLLSEMAGLKKETPAVTAIPAGTL